MMKKSEWITLILAISSICLFFIALSMDYGGWRTFLGYLSFPVFIFSLGGWKNQEQRFNRVEKILIVLFFSALAVAILYSLLYCGITDSHDGWIYLTILALILVAGGWIAWYNLYGNGWLYQRLSWIGGSFLPIEKMGKGQLTIWRVESLDKNWLVSICLR